VYMYTNGCVIDTVEQARGGVVHTPGFTSQSPGGDSCARMMPGVGPRWGRPGCRDSPRWGRRFHRGFKLDLISNLNRYRKTGDDGA
jgi:hypothetical protein